METELVTVSGEQQTQEDEMADRKDVIASVRADELPEDVQNQLRAEGRRQAEEELQPATTVVGEMRVLLELDESEDAGEIITKVRELVNAQRSSELEEQIDDAMSEVSGELMRSAVRERVLSRVEPGVTEEELKGEIASAMELPHIKVLAGERKIPVVIGGGSNDKSGRKATAWT